VWFLFISFPIIGVTYVVCMNVLLFRLFDAEIKKPVQRAKFLTSAEGVFSFVFSELTVQCYGN